MKTFASFCAPLVALAGCISVPPEIDALRYAEALQGKGAPVFHERTLEGKKWLMAKRGIGLLEADSRVAFVNLAIARRKTGSWPAIREIPVKNGLWFVRVVDDCLLLEAQPSVAGVIRQTVLSPEAYLAIDGKLVPYFETLERALQNGGPSAPIIPISTR